MADKKIVKTVGKLGVGQASHPSVDEKDMAQIREILFGEQTREANNRIARIESLLSAQDKALRELLDVHVERATTQLREELGNRDRRQTTALDALHAELNALLQKTDERLTLLDSDLQESRQQTDRSLDQFQKDSVDRSQLADLFESLAGQLRKTSEK